MKLLCIKKSIYRYVKNNIIFDISKLENNCYNITALSINGYIENNKKFFNFTVPCDIIDESTYLTYLLKYDMFNFKLLEELVTEFESELKKVIDIK